MSGWDTYIDNVIGHSQGECDKACIIGLDGGAKWTSDNHASSFKISQQEATAIAAVMNSEDFSPFQASGITIEGLKYQFLRQDDGVVLAKKKDNGAVTLQKSVTAIVIGHTKNGGQQGSTNKAVNVIAEYLLSLGM